MGTSTTTGCIASLKKQGLEIPTKPFNSRYHRTRTDLGQTGAKVTTATVTMQQYAVRRFFADTGCLKNHHSNDGSLETEWASSKICCTNFTEDLLPLLILKKVPCYATIIKHSFAKQCLKMWTHIVITPSHFESMILNVCHVDFVYRVIIIIDIVLAAFEEDYFLINAVKTCRMSAKLGLYIYYKRW